MTAPIGLAAGGALGRVRAQVAPITAITLFGLSMSMSYPLFGLLLERGGASGTAIGLNQSGPALAIVVFAPLMPLLVARLGLVRLMLVAIALLCTALVLVPLWQNLWYWTGLRLFLGAAATALFYASEFWVVGAASDARRGRIVGIYAISVSAAFMAGPLLLRLIGVTGTLPFLVSAAIVALGVLPILWGRLSAPGAEAGDATRPGTIGAALRFFRSDPSIMWGAMLFGTIEFGTLGLVPVWAVRSGLSEAAAVTLLALFGFGCMAFQWPIGWLADRYPRRRMMVWAGAFCVAAPLLMLVAAPVFALIAPAIVLWGGTATGLYTLALTEIGARYRGARLAEANAGLILAYGFGALAAPLAAGTAMDLVPPDGLLWLSVTLALAYVGFVAWREARG